MMPFETPNINRAQQGHWQQIGDVAKAIVSRSSGLIASQAAITAPALCSGPPRDCSAPPERGAGNDCKAGHAPALQSEK